MPKVPLISPQVRRNPAGLGDAVSESESRKWGEGFAKLGEGVARVGSALAKMDHTNKQTADALMVARAKQLKKQSVLDAMEGSVVGVRSRDEYVDLMRQRTSDDEKNILKTLGDQYGPMSAVTQQKVLTEFANISAGYADDISTRGVQHQTAFIKNELDNFNSASIAGVYADPASITEAIAEQESFIVNLHEEFGMLPDDPRTEQTIRAQAKSLYTTGIESLMERGRFRDANMFVTAAQQVKALSPEEVKSFTDTIRQRRDEWANKERVDLKHSEYVQDLQLKRKSIDNYGQLLRDLDKARSEGDMKSISELESMRLKLLAEGEFRPEEFNQSGSVIGQLIEEASHKASLDIAEDYYRLNTEKDLVALQADVMRKNAHKQMLDKQAESWLSTIQNKVDNVKTNPEIEKLITKYSSAIRMLSGANEQNLATVLQLKYKGRPDDPNYIAYKTRVVQPDLEFHKEIEKLGRGTLTGDDLDVLFKQALDRTVLGSDVYRPTLFKGRPVPDTQDKLKQEILFLDTTMQLKKNQGTYSKEEELEARKHIDTVNQALKTKEEFETTKKDIIEDRRKDHVIRKQQNLMDSAFDAMTLPFGVDNMSPSSNDVMIPFR